MASKAVPGLSAQLSDLPVVRGHAPWPGHEYVKGWGVFGLPFDSGHVLALRVFPENDFGPYRAVWHRDPGGRWSIHVDGPRLDTACPRYFGPACDFTGHARIGLTWDGPATLRVTMDSPALDWTLTATSTRLLEPPQHDERGDAARHMAPATAGPGPGAAGQRAGNGPACS